MHEDMGAQIARIGTRTSSRRTFVPRTLAKINIHRTAATAQTIMIEVYRSPRTKAVWPPRGIRKFIAFANLKSIANLSDHDINSHVPECRKRRFLQSSAISRWLCAGLSGSVRVAAELVGRIEAEGVIRRFRSTAAQSLSFAESLLANRPRAAIIRHQAENSPARRIAPSAFAHGAMADGVG